MCCCGGIPSPHPKNYAGAPAHLYLVFIFQVEGGRLTAAEEIEGVRFLGC